MSQNQPWMEVTWTDPVTGRHGFLVIDRLVRGVCSGGLRMRQGCTLAEVRDLAAAMTLKEGLHYDPANHYVPLGGAKGGLDISPHDPGAQAMLTRFLRSIRVLVQQHWTLGEDLGLRQSDIDTAIVAAGMSSSIEAIYPLLPDPESAITRLKQAFAITVDGVGLDELVGGLGVAQSALTALQLLGLPTAGTRAVVQGFGSMGGATARFLHQAGVRVVAIADADGVVANPQGLDVETLLLSRDTFGRLDRTRLRPTDELLPADRWLSIDCDLLVPAAVSYCVDLENQQQISARLIVEAANLPVSPEAEKALAERSVVVVPDFVANSATNAWWWWTLFGDIGADADQAFAKIRTQLDLVTREAFAAAQASGTTVRTAAHQIASQRLTEITARFGTDPFALEPVAPVGAACTAPVNASGSLWGA